MPINSKWSKLINLKIEIMITILTKDHLKKLAADKVLAFELIKNNNDKSIA